MKEWNEALTEDFNLHTPLEVKWDAFEDSFLRRFHERHPDIMSDKGAADCHTHCLVFCRGWGETRLKNRFMGQKADLALNYIIFQPLRWVKARLAGCEVPVINNTGRATLRHRLPSVWDIVKNFFSEIEISEPTIHNVVVIYRSKEDGASSTIDKEFYPNPTIHVRAFTDIPVADIEIIFGHLEFLYKPTFVVQLIVTVVVAVVAVGLKFKEVHSKRDEQGEVSYTLIIVAVGLLIIRIVQLVMKHRSEMKNTESAITQSLYYRTLGSERAVLVEILDSMEEQEVKEAILGYCTLIKAGERGLTMEELDDQVEYFLKDEFDVDIDFEVDDSLRKLEESSMILVKKDRYIAKSPTDIVPSLKLALQKVQFGSDGGAFKMGGETARYTARGRKQESCERPNQSDYICDCGNRLMADSVFCRKCGVKSPVQKQQPHISNIASLRKSPSSSTKRTQHKNVLIALPIPRTNAIDMTPRLSQAKPPPRARRSSRNAKQMRSPEHASSTSGKKQKTKH